MIYETLIGLEVHAELKTKTKAFCQCPVTYKESPNSCCCPVCMGLPGALPVLNKTQVEYAIKLGLALNCEINSKSVMARKNYFYPDLPKGYQISQSELPLCTNGHMDLNGRKIRIERIHIEEDAGKLIHENGVTKIDFNRAGVPLVEIVTKPDIRSSREARLFVEKIREILLYLDISDCKMQQGQLRCDVNVSIRKTGDENYSERCEMKNINSFSGIERCIKYEEDRQKEIVSKGGSISRETRKWIDEENKNLLMRNKESMEDYRYFPEPDLPPVILNADYIESIRASLPELPEKKRQRFKEAYGFSEYECNESIKNKHFAAMIDEAVFFNANPKRVYNLLVSDVARLINENGIEPDKLWFSGKEMADLVHLLEKGEITSTTAKAVIECMFAEEKPPLQIVKEKGFTQLSDPMELEKIVREVIRGNPKSLSDYKKGKTNASGFLMGQCMRRAGNCANPAIMAKILKEILEEKV